MTDRSRAFAIAASAAGSFLLLDSLRVWFPSLTTIFGSAGTTSAITLALFALAWVVPIALLLPLATSRYGRWLPMLAALIAVAARIVLQRGGSPDLQLYASSVAACALFVWLVAIAARGWPPRQVASGFAVGIAATVLMQLASGGVDLTWQANGFGAGLLSLCAGVLVFAGWRVGDDRAEGGAAFWFAAMPALVLSGLISISLGRIWAPTEWPPGWWGGALVGIGAIGGVLIALRGGVSRHGWLAAPLLLAAVALADLSRDGESFPAWIAWPQAWVALLIPAVLIHAAQARECRAGWRGVAAYAGLLIGFVLAVVYYVAFDMILPVPRPAFVLAIAASIALAGIGRRASTIERYSPVALGIAAIACALSGVFAYAAAPAAALQTQRAAAWPLRVMTYNVRYGISDDGRFDPDEIARVIAAQDPDVVMLQEVDRGFLLNGSHDVLALLQRRLRMHVYYNPASEPLFGDAILSRWPLREVRREALPTYDVATRPGVLSAVLELDDGDELALAVSHLHEKEGGVDVRQVRDLAAKIAMRGEDGRRPLILAGDYNLEPSDARLRPLLTMLRDGLSDARPLPTWPAAHPRQQLDYLFLSTQLQATDIVAPKTIASDHRPVVATVDRQYLR